VATGGDDRDGAKRQDAPLALTKEDIPAAALAAVRETYYHRIALVASLSGYYCSYILEKGTGCQEVWHCAT